MNLAGQGGINCQNCLYCFFYKEGAPAALSCVSSIGLVRYQDMPTDFIGYHQEIWLSPSNQHLLPVSI